MNEQEVRAGASAIAEALVSAGLKPTVEGEGRWVTVTCQAGAMALRVKLAQAGVFAHVEKTKAALVFRVHPRHANAQPQLRLLKGGGR